MPISRRPLRYRVADAATQVQEITGDPDELAGLSPVEVLELVELSTAIRQGAERLCAAVAGEVARRSHPELGYDGLARRAGFRTVEEFVKTKTGVTGKEAVKAVRVGRMLHDAALGGEISPITGEVAEVVSPWMAPAVDTVTAGRLSVTALDAISGGIGQPSSAVSVEMLSAAVAGLCREAIAEGIDPDRLGKRARELRDEIDITGVPLREEERRERRALTLRELPDGMGLLTWRLDPEGLVQVKDLYDRITSPKLGGVKFVEKNEAGTNSTVADLIDKDPRTPAQLASDDFLQLLRQGAEANTDFLLGTGAPIVRATTTVTDLTAREGVGFLEGMTDAVSMTTVERLACTGGIEPILFDENFQPLNVGREHRFYTVKQRIALAVRDGGCRWGTCERPPSWTEAHHVQHWHRDHGETNIADGDPALPTPPPPPPQRRMGNRARPKPVLATTTEKIRPRPSPRPHARQEQNHEATQATDCRTGTRMSAGGPLI